MRLSFSESRSGVGPLLERFHAFLLLQFWFELLSGAILACFYRSGSPYQSDTRLHQTWLREVQAYHYWASALLILESLGLTILLAWGGKTQSQVRPLYLSGFLIFLASLGFQLTGNVLPFDHHGVQTGVIEASIAARVPVLGNGLSGLILGGNEFSAATVERWYVFHLSVTLLAIIATVLALNVGSDYRKQLRPLLIAVALLPGFVLALIIPSPLGSQATSADFSSFSDRASWYTQPLHGALVMCSRLNSSLGWVGAMAIPGLFVASLLSLAWIKRKAAERAGKAVIAGAALFFGVASIGFGGAIDPITGTRDPVQATASTKKSSPINRMLAATGRQLFNSKGCSDCHGADGLNGKAGPTLTSVQSKHGEADYYVRYVKNPTAVDPNSTMPAFPQLTQNQLSAIAEYLRMPNKPNGPTTPSKIK